MFEEVRTRGGGGMTNLILAEEEGVLPWQRDPLLQNEKSVLVPTVLQGPSSVGSREFGVY